MIDTVDVIIEVPTAAMNMLPAYAAMAGPANAAVTPLIAQAVIFCIHGEGCCCSAIVAAVRDSCLERLLGTILLFHNNT
jgi:hypothetical protein